jgi:hypothetical protein
MAHLAVAHFSLQPVQRLGECSHFLVGAPQLVQHKTQCRLLTYAWEFGKLVYGVLQ